MDLQEITDRIFKNMSETMREKPKDSILPPIALIFKGDNMGMIPTTPLAPVGPAWRDVLSHIIKAIHEHERIDAYCIGVETYGMVNPSAELLERAQRGDLKTLADIPRSERDELLILTAGDNFQTITRIWRMQRDPETGLYNQFDEEDVPRDCSFGTTFCDLLIERPKHLN